MEEAFVHEWTLQDKEEEGGKQEEEEDNFGWLFSWRVT